MIMRSINIHYRTLLCFLKKGVLTKQKLELVLYNVFMICLKLQSHSFTFSSMFRNLYHDQHCTGPDAYSPNIRDHPLVKGLL